MCDLQNRSFVSILDYNYKEISYILRFAHYLKAQRFKKILGSSLAGKTIALLFEKNSSRTRSAFEVAIREEAGHAVFFEIGNSHFSAKESIEDSAKVFAGFYHGIAFRGFAQSTARELANYLTVPVYNSLTNEEHPTQIITDLMTIQELLPNKDFTQIKIAYIGDAKNNIAHTWLYACAILGMQFIVYAPKEYYPTTDAINIAAKIAKLSGAKITISSDIACLDQADIIYTDTWISMGEQPELIASKINILQSYRVTKKIMTSTNNEHVIFMHCLPALHDQKTTFAQNILKQFNLDVTEVEDGVFRSKASVVFQQAHNKLHAIKAILLATLTNSKIELY